MNTADYCPEGRELYAEYERCMRTFREFARIHMQFMMTRAYQAYRQHVDNECDVCRTSTKGIRDAHKEE
jgi:hypothetical protein